MMMDERRFVEAECGYYCNSILARRKRGNFVVGELFWILSRFVGIESER